jgi:MotA/TolQ/ExbB proton channel family
VNGRLTFLSHLVICLACAGVAFFAWANGVPQTIWANAEARWFGVAIGILVVSAMGWLGGQSWIVDLLSDKSRVANYFPHATKITVVGLPDASYGHLVGLLCPAIGMLGTIVGLSEVFARGGDTIAMIQKAQTAFYSTGCGIVAMIIAMILTHNLESGIKRAGR